MAEIFVVYDKERTYNVLLLYDACVLSYNATCQEARDMWRALLETPILFVQRFALEGILVTFSFGEEKVTDQKLYSHPLISF